jgi:hypothetical protein
MLKFHAALIMSTSTVHVSVLPPFGHSKGSCSLDAISVKLLHFNLLLLLNRCGRTANKMSYYLIAFALYKVKQHSRFWDMRRNVCGNQCDAIQRHSNLANKYVLINKDEFDLMLLLVGHQNGFNIFSLQD